MHARSTIPPDHQTDRALAAAIRDLLLYGLLFFQPFAFLAANLFFGSDQTGPLSDEGNLYNQLAVPVEFCAVCILVYRYRIPARVFWAALIPMAPLLLMIVLSTVWSDYPELTIRRASREILEATALGLLATCFSNPNIVLAIFFRAFLIIGCLDLVSSAVFPEAFTVIGFAGIHGQKNVAGQFFFAALPVYLLATLYREISGNRLLGLFSLVSGLAMFVQTDSKTSLGAVFVGFSFVLLTQQLSRRIPVPVVFLLFTGLLCAIPVIMSYGSHELLETLIGDPTLTGRDLIWRYVGDKFDGSPIVGVGYGAIWQVGPQLESALKELGIGWLLVNEAHNGYLEIAAQLGIVGICCLLIYVMATLLNVISYWAKLEQNSLCGAGALATYIFWGLILSNITESLYFQAGNGSSCIFIFLSAFVASRSKRSVMMSTAKGAPLNPELVRYRRPAQPANRSVAAGDL